MKKMLLRNLSDKLILLSERLDAFEKLNSNKIIEREFLFSLKVNIPTIGFKRLKTISIK
jgi:hypothetical protein